MNRGYVTPGAAGLIVFIVGTVIGTVLIAMAGYAEHSYRQNADRRHIDRESDLCVIRVEASCGDDICRYKTSVPCDELEALTRSSKRKERKYDAE